MEKKSKRKFGQQTKRTWEDFVEELIDHRTIKQICAIALSSRWCENLPEIKIHAKKLRKLIKYRKKPQVNSTMGYNIYRRSKKLL